MKKKELEKKYFILLLKEMRLSLSYIKNNQRNRLHVNDEINILNLERFLDDFIEKEMDELEEMKGE